MKTRRKREDVISDLCDQAGCNEKVRAIHRDQYVKRRYQPHPPSDFTDWWYQGGGWQFLEKVSGRGWCGVDAARAWNCDVVRQGYLEAKHVGVAE